MKTMLAALCFVLPAAAASSASTPQTESIAACTAQRLAPFVGPYGVRQAWPVATALPGMPLTAIGVLLSDAGQVMDGYTQRLHVNVNTGSAYVVQQGGFAGIQTVFGPLPLAYCASPARR